MTSPTASPASTVSAQGAALADLIAKLEAATGPDRELSARIFCAVTDGAEIGRNSLGGPIIQQHGAEWPLDEVVPTYTASLDAARSLLDAEWYWRVGNDGEGPDPSLFKAEVMTGAPECRFASALAETAELALCAAALKARAALSQAQGEGGAE